MDCAWQIIIDEGVHDLTTTRVAEMANINVAALYQYFANREMIVTALVERHLIVYENDLTQILVSMRDQPMLELVDIAIDQTINQLVEIRDELQEIFKIIPIMTDSSVVASVEAILLDFSRDYLVHNKLSIQGGVATLYVATNAIILVVIRWLLDPPYSVPEKEFKASLKQLVESLWVTSQTGNI